MLNYSPLEDPEREFRSRAHYQLDKLECGRLQKTEKFHLTYNDTIIPSDEALLLSKESIHIYREKLNFSFTSGSSVVKRLSLCSYSVSLLVTVIVPVVTAW